MVAQIISPKRQAKKRIMKNFNLKTGKQFQKWIKKERRENKNESTEAKI